MLIIKYYYTIFEYIFLKKGYNNIKFFKNEIEQKIMLYTFCSIYNNFNNKHYRIDTYGKDIYNNCKDLVFPSTNIPLNIVFLNKYTLIIYMLIHPIVILLINIIQYFRRNIKFIESYKNMLFVNNWFGYWRVNCNINFLYYLSTFDKDLKYEDKYLFIKKCMENHINISPLIDIDEVFIKHKYIEGGQSCFKFKNVLKGGNWIIQEKFENSEFVKNLLPNNAPLSTIRIVSLSNNNNIDIISSVFRAGLNNSKTDHNSILFDICIDSGKLLYGKSNNNWYKNRKIQKNILFSKHPETNKTIEGNIIPEWKYIKNLIYDAHEKISPNVPIIGWDVALTDKGIFLLEANYSCSFFDADFDKSKYYKYINKSYKNNLI